IVRERKVGTAHVVEGGWERRRRVRLLVGTGRDGDDDLQWRVEGVDHAPERVQPSKPVILRSAGEPNRSGLDHGETAVSGPAFRLLRADDADQRRLPIWGRGRCHLRRWLPTT